VSLDSEFGVLSEGSYVGSTAVVLLLSSMRLWVAHAGAGTDEALYYADVGVFGFVLCGSGWHTQVRPLTRLCTRVKVHIGPIGAHDLVVTATARCDSRR
jgi:hypothetical protein